MYEAVTGFGKTEVVSVLQAIQQADGERLVMLSMPAQLLTSKAEEIQRYLGDAFDRKVEVMHFDRTSDVSVEALAIFLTG